MPSSSSDELLGGNGGSFPESSGQDHSLPGEGQKRHSDGKASFRDRIRGMLIGFSLLQIGFFFHRSSLVLGARPAPNKALPRRMQVFNAADLLAFLENRADEDHDSEDSPVRPPVVGEDTNKSSATAPPIASSSPGTRTVVLRGTRGTSRSSPGGGDDGGASSPDE